MKLKDFFKTAGKTPSEAGYACPMHPEVVQDTPGKCPKCKMDLVKKEAKQEKKSGGCC